MSRPRPFPFRAARRDTSQRRSPRKGKGRGRLMRVVQIPNGAFVENSYLVIDAAAAECAVIDPGEEAGLILREIAATGTRATAIWITHAHLDHVMGVLRVRRATAAPVYLHPADRELYDHAVQQGLAFGVAVQPPAAPPRAPGPRG